MAEIIEILLKGQESPEIIAKWLKRTHNDCTVPDVLLDLENIKQEFIPYFLNYLRDHTLHLLQSSKSATPSPAKTPSLKKFHKSERRSNGRESSKRQQLFGASPAGDSEDVQALPSSVFSPNASLDSPGLITHKGDRSHGKGRSGYSSQKGSPQCGSQRSPYINQTPDQQRSKQKLSLGEFITTPDQNTSSQNWKKKSPHSGGRRDTSFESSPTVGHSRRSGGRRKHSSSPLVQNFNCNNESRQVPSPPVFSLSCASDFPPVSIQEQDNKSHNLSFIETKPKQCSQSGRLDSRKKTTVFSENKTKHLEACDNRISREINFSSPDSSKLTSISSNRLQDVKHFSPSDNRKSQTGPRRITPTFVKGDKSVSQNSVFLVPIQEADNKENIVTVFSQGAIVSDKSTCLEEERELLKQEKERWKTISQVGDGSSTCLSSLTPKKPGFEHSTSVIETIEAVLADVTHQDSLDLLVALYSRCLTENLFPNVIVELYFLVQLLTARGYSGTGEEDVLNMSRLDVSEENFFTTVHNTVYFAVSVLEEQKRLLSMLDRGTLRLLIENPRITAFSLSLKNKLEELYDKADVLKGPAYPRSPIGSVSFQADTDNRMNFPNDRAFHMFKRQRDGFYELLREWEASRMNPNYNMANVFGNQVRALVSMGNDLVNLIHFSRLFQSQLIAMCKGDGSIRTNEDDESIALLSQLKRTNPEKFKRLQERFIKPFSFGGPCPPPSFPGCQEFFRDFIMVAGSPMLNQHLSDTFTAKIQELDETSFSAPDEDEQSSANEDDEEKDIFRSVLMNLRLIGKFLGYVTFLPYQSTDRVPESMESTYISMRNKHQPSIDMMKCLRSAVLSGRMTLTVPWVVEYLSMMDKMAPRLDYLQAILLYLLYIQRCMWTRFQEEYTYSSLVIVGLVSWLLENPVIPDGLFFTEIPEDFIDLESSFPSLAALDYRGFVDQSLFYTCCPYIGEMKALLVEFAVGTSSKTSTIRKITPVSADVPVQKSLTDRQLQLQMEENFFHNHAASMKRVVDFVADRTASNFIKKFRSGLLQLSINDGKDKILKQLLSVSEGSPTSKLKDKVTMVTKKVAQEIHGAVKARVTEEAPKYCNERTPTIIELLLPDDQSNVVVAMAADISKRVAMEKITHWMSKNMTTVMYQTELSPDLEKVTKAIQSNSFAQMPVSESKVEGDSIKQDTGSKTADKHHDDSFPHPSEVLIDLKDMVKNFMLRSHKLTREDIHEKLELIAKVLNNRQDVLPSVYKAFGQLTAELLIAIMIYQEELHTEDVINEFINLWMTHLRGASIHQIFSGRVVQMLHNDNMDSWDKYTKLLMLLYKENLIELSHIQDACVRFLPYVQDASLITSLCRCLCELTTTIPELERGESIGACLEMIYHMLSDRDSDVGKQVLDVLGVHNNNHVKNSLENNDV